MAFVSTSNLDATNDARGIRSRTRQALGLDKQVALPHGTPAISMQGRELTNLIERFISNALDNVEDPAFDFCQLHIDWQDPEGLFGYPSLENKNCAWSYLTRIGETKRADMLKNCMSTLQSIFDDPKNSKGNDRGYYLKSIDGLGSLNEAKRSIAKPCELTLQLYDDVCWRLRTVSAMLETIYYDRYRQLEILPVNLRRFNATILIKDCRDLRGYLTTSAMQRLNNVTSKEAEQQARQALTVADHLFVAEEANSSDFPDHVQSMIIKLYCCELGTTPLPDSINNTEPAELSSSLKLTALGFDYALLAPAIDMAVQTAIQTSSANATENDATLLAKLLRKAKTAMQAQVAATLTSYINAGYNISKSMLMNMAYDQLDSSGVLDIANKAIALTSGDIAGAKLSAYLAERMADSVMHSTYFTDKKFIDEPASNDKRDGYFADKRSL